MAEKLAVTLIDINGETGTTDCWVGNALAAIQVCQKIADLSNAQVVGAFLTSQIDITGIPDNVAVATNIETVTTKLKVIMSGVDVGSTTTGRGKKFLNIPAPVGTIYNGDVAAAKVNPLLTAFIPLVKSASDVTMDRIDNVMYSG